MTSNTCSPTKRSGNMTLSDIGPVIPVADFKTLAQAEYCAALYSEVGVPSVEVTLRRGGAWDCITHCIKAMPDAEVGVGTVINAEQLKQAKDIGATFAISPGLSPELVELAEQLSIRYYPGVATASELMQAVALGLTELKFFPAQAAGGIAMLKSLCGPFGNIRFCPTGGISAANYNDYLALENVSCVGGSWVVPEVAQSDSERSEHLTLLANIYKKS